MRIEVTDSALELWPDKVRVSADIPKGYLVEAMECFVKLDTRQREEEEAKKQAELDKMLGIVKPGRIFAIPEPNTTYAQSIFDDPHDFAQNEENLTPLGYE